ncbi:hypothetical protein BH09BAC6_BH09BAC6_24780 [soil metagenome]
MPTHLKKLKKTLKSPVSFFLQGFLMSNLIGRLMDSHFRHI